MNQVISFFPDALVHAIGWTLLHSLWQGAFIALLLGMLLVLLHRQSANLRYAVAGGAMLSQLLLAAGTFCYYYSQSQSLVISTAAATSTGLAAETSVAALAAAPVQASFCAEPFTVAQVYLGRHMPLLVTLWLVGIIMMAIRFIGGIAYAQRLRHYRTTPLGADWQQKVNAMGKAMGVDEAVRLVESALVQVPMVIGFAKPVILLPIGVLTGLTQPQVEAVLAHELAHVLRKD